MDIIVDEHIEILEIYGNTDQDIIFTIPDNSKLIAINICICSAKIVGNIPDRCVITHFVKK
jgi:hypothetical protein